MKFVLCVCERETAMLLISTSRLMSVQMPWLLETWANHSMNITLVLVNLSSGTMMTKMGRKGLSVRTTNPCWLTSVHQLEVKTKNRLTRHTASSPSGGWRTSTHSEDNTVEDTHTHRQEITSSLWYFHVWHKQKLIWTLMQHCRPFYVLYHQSRLKLRSVFICHFCICFFIHKNNVNNNAFFHKSLCS